MLLLTCLHRIFVLCLSRCDSVKSVKFFEVLKSFINHCVKMKLIKRNHCVPEETEGREHRPGEGTQTREGARGSWVNIGTPRGGQVARAEPPSLFMVLMLHLACAMGCIHHSSY